MTEFSSKGFHATNFSNMLSEETKVKVPDNIEMIQSMAERLFFEDQSERDAKKYGVSYVIIAPDTKYAGMYLCSVVFNKEPSITQSGSFLSSGPSEHRRVGVFTSFEQADAWMEKNKYFGLKNTKHYEGIYASWG